MVTMGGALIAGVDGVCSNGIAATAERAWMKALELELAAGVALKEARAVC